MILGPASAMRSRSDWSKPRIMAVMPTIDVMPITTPSTVSAERILFDQIVAKAITTTSRKSPSRIATSHPSGARGRLQTSDLLVPQRLDGIQTRRLERRPHAEEDADRRREAQPDCERPPRQGDGEAGCEVDGPADAAAKGDAEQAAHRREK